MRTILPGLIAAFTSLSACAGPWSIDGLEDDCPTAHSTAWCILSASQKANGFQDTSPSKFKESGMQWGEIVSSATGLALNTTGAFKAVPGVSSGAVSGMFVISLLAAASPPTFNGKTVLFGFMPKDDATDAIEASNKISGLLTGALSEVFAGSTMDVAPVFREGKISANESNLVGVKVIVKGGLCEGSICEAYLLRSPRTLELKTAPKYLGGYEGWKISDGAGFFRFMWDGVDQTGLLAKAISKKLPSWLFIGVGPEGSTEMPDGRKVLGNAGMKVAAVYRSGVPMILTFPEVDLSAIAN